MSKTSHNFFKAIESPMRLSNLLSIKGSFKDICFFLESQLYNLTKQVNLKTLDLNSFSLKNYILEDDIVHYEKITLLCDESELNVTNDECQINVNFFTINGIRQKFLEEIAACYPKISFTNSFFNVNADYCGRSIFSNGTYQLIEHDLFSNRFGSTFSANFSLSTMFTEQLTYEIPTTLSFFESPFDFYQAPKFELHIMRVDIPSLEFLLLLTNKENNLIEHEELIDKFRNSTHLLIKYLINSTNFSLINLQTDEVFSFHQYPIIDLSNFNNLLAFVKHNHKIFSSLLIALQLEKQYLEQREAKQTRKKKNKNIKNIESKKDISNPKE